MAALAALVLALTACSTGSVRTGLSSGDRSADAPDADAKFADPDDATEPPLVPRPASLARRAGSYSLPEVLPMHVAADDAGAHDVGLVFAERVQASCGRAVDVRRIPAADRLDSGVRMRRSAPHPLSHDAGAVTAEAYTLRVRPDGIEVSAATDQGLRHGTTTLLQLVCAGGDSVPALHIDDAPRFAWRGLMLDSARHWQSPDFIRRLLDAMALHKLNVLHWHLTDDQAWRLEIRGWPRLADVGGWRVPAGAAARQDIDPATGAPRRIGGIYTQQTVRGLVAYAARRGITIVPEIEMPGHASAALAAYPQFAASPSPPREVPSDWGIYPNAFALTDETFAFLEDVLREVMDLFPSRWIHVGGDEVEPAQWLASETGQARLRALGSTEPGALQAWFTARIARFLDANGRRLVGWDEILTPALPRGAVVMSWRGTEGAIRAAAQGHDTVLSPWPTLYFDNRQALGPDEPPGRARVVTLQDVYAFDPLPPELDAGARARVLGLQGNVWTEHVRTEARVGYMAFPRIAAVAELGWTPAVRRDWPGFAARAAALFPHYAALGLAHAPVTDAASTAAVAQGMSSCAAGSRAQAPGCERRNGAIGSHALELCSEHIALALEDDAPIDGDRAVFLVDIQNPCWRLPDIDLAQVTAIRARVGQVPFNFQIGEAVHAIGFPRPHTVHGELEVRRGCEGELLARLPLAPATASQGVTELPAAALQRGIGVHDLCLRFAQTKLDPLWVIDAVELVP